ncbi:hypothetical protein [Thalassotalea sp. SU-HH00458]|uniref:hypothetical protein n=1 Tax=Thalassotalea sp. SU-HH00458 TaxID=3127657 RepID=UPI00310BD45C
MNNQKHFIMILMSFLLCLPSIESQAQEANSNYAIPFMDDAKIFAQFTHELPAVMNYFTAHTEQEIIAFYESNFGKATSSELKRERLTLYFTHHDKQLRVIISQQDKKNQVDILLR